MLGLKYPRLNNKDLAELLDTARLLHYKDLPERLKGEHLPTGHDLIEAIKERLVASDGFLAQEMDFRCKIDLNYLFCHNHDFATYIEEAVMVACDRGLTFYNRGLDEIVPEIIQAIKEHGMVARATNETFELWVAPNLQDHKGEGEVFYMSKNFDWKITTSYKR